ncbi:CDP-diacylglycerol--glycerol-3-phosphate 3-phosphatidyltransferase [Amylibacter marinus]|uniref:CDP-diacylglycerol--glycerol-3-phosphate 3-phosphatidyltransferase n=1 Tax=Amylibacter marinus TaxID=1475483 RepID=A0ABQ5VWW9_9RHOB|nr:CDP-diacylglycerol--glycerol-3-phosphate 3-phosphatidyltransferase [Amylibacter marinus]GLQ35922.1 CDP-diacylglycerol--glycerol-3-phosphate 3-phosphatidyltransferase [Amylibacter marinus]
MRWNIPNILTTFRMLAAPAVVLVFLFFQRPVADWLAMILFIGAAFTDYLDGYLARKWNQVSNFGRMLDPIADKAMVVLAFLVIGSLFGLNPLIMVPAILILLREVFVSGLREFLGDKAGELQVTKLAKFKTAAQMISVSILFSYGIFEHNFGASTIGMDGQLVGAILDGTEEDVVGLKLKYNLMYLSYWGGIAFLWVAGALTFITGMDYLRKAMPYLRGAA